eukprot:GFUD01000064.1.p1 GENE.GFUD01000064.1~~GFUD01000064.1.p1  ORF type:complete len:712 (-),score=186.20 GFUD01000064.1:96-2231(-)
MAELLQFKLYLNIGGKQEEVRRFSCDSNTDIGRLNVHIKETFPHLGEQEFVMKWEDEEGDKVDITSQQELVLALQEMKKICSVYKIHVQLLENPWWKQVQKNTTKTSLNSLGEEHPGIICSCCHHQVRGFRYKCVVCPNYDMCGLCEDKAMHPAHDMVRIPTPRSYPPHFFMRLHRLYERCTHSSPTLVKPGCGPMSSPNEQMAKDLLDDDSSDISDLELEVNLVPEGGKSSAPNLLTRKRVKSDPGSCPNVAEQIAPLGNNKKNHLLLQENLPSFEELTKSMQDLAEKDLDEYYDNDMECSGTSESLGKSDAKMCEKPLNGDVTQSGTQIHEGIQFLRNSCFPKDKFKQNPESATLDNVQKFSPLKIKENTSITSKSISNNNEEELIDTSESFRNLQQEIESLLAPLTPLPDLESVPKVVKTSDNKEIFVMMNNMKIADIDNRNSRTGSFEIVENIKEFEESRSMDEWSLLGDKQMMDSPNEGKENTLKEETGNESSETETEDQVDSSGDDDCNGNVVSKDDTDVKENELGDITDNKKYAEDEMLPQSKWTVRLDKEIKDLENSAIASSKYLSKSMDKVGLNNKLEDSLKNIENSLKSTSTKFATYGGSSGSDGESPTVSRPSTNQPKQSVPLANPTEFYGGHIPRSTASQGTNYSSAGRPRHYNPRIADALDKMIGMGFSDEDGWLTQLLVMKHGDISQVLDILTPVKK